MNRRTVAVIVLAFAVATFVLYVPLLDYVPPYLYDAEVLFALHAHAIATTLHDTNGRLLPVYFQMPRIGDNVWFHPVIVYATAPLLAIVPFSDTTVRVPSVIVGVIDVVLLFLVARRIFRSDAWGACAALLLMLTPSHFIHSRVLMDYVYPLPFVLGWMLGLLAYLDTGRTSRLFLATSLLGVGVYSYIASLAMMPLYLVLTWGSLLMTGRREARPYVVAAAGFAWPLVFAVSWVAAHPKMIGETLGRYVDNSTVSVPGVGRVTLTEALEQLRKPPRFSSLIGRVSLYWYFFDPSFLFLSGGYTNPIDSVRHVGVFVFPMVVFIPAGLAALAGGRRTAVDLLIAIGFVSAPLAACLAVPEPYAIDRELQLVLFGALVATVGLRTLLASRARWVRAAAIALAALIPVHFAYFLYDYYGDYRGRSASWFESNHRGAVEEILARAPADHPPAIYISLDRDQYLDAYYRFYLIQHKREDLLAHTVQFTWKDFDASAIPRGSLVLATLRDDRAAPAVKSGALRVVALIPEPADPPQFEILER